MTSMQRQNYRGTPAKVSKEVQQRHREAVKSVVPQDSYSLLIGGEWVESEGGTVEDSIDVITGETLAEYQHGTSVDVDRAVDAAENAYEGEWGSLSGPERAEYLEAIADELEKQGERLVRLDTLETGIEAVQTPFLKNMAADQFRYFAALIRTIDRGRQPTIIDSNSETNPNTDQHVYTVDEPYGPVGLITGWNYATTYIGFKFAPVLAAGNTVVFKPSLRGVLSALEAAKLFDDVLPDGVVNIVPGDGPTVGESITTHDRIRKVSLTGSVEAGQEVMRGAASNLKDIHLELGGKSPSIIFPDADLEAAAQAVPQNIFPYAGQGCTFRSRLFVHEDIYDDFLEMVSEMTEQIFNPGDPLAEETTFAPLVDHEQLDRVESYVETAREEGATVFLGGNRLHVNGLGDAPFFEPTILTDVDNDDTVACEEIFGPVLSVIKWNNCEEVIRQANNSKYGLAASVWTEDLTTAHEVSQAMEAGSVDVNGGTTSGGGGLHGGYKQSGISKEFGKEAYEDYRRKKIIGINLS